MQSLRYWYLWGISDNSTPLLSQKAILYTPLSSHTLFIFVPAVAQCAVTTPFSPSDQFRKRSNLFTAPPKHVVKVFGKHTKHSINTDSENDCTSQLWKRIHRKILCKCPTSFNSFSRFCLCLLFSFPSKFFPEKPKLFVFFSLAFW